MNTQRFHRTVSLTVVALCVGQVGVSQTSTSSNPPPVYPNSTSTPTTAGEGAGQAVSHAADAVSSGLANVGRKIETVANSLRTASTDEQAHATDKLIGRKVQDGQGNELGQVKDFLIDSQSGQIRFAVVSGGGLFGVGDTSHMIPFSSLQSAGDHYTASLSKSEWSQLPSVASDSSGQPANGSVIASASPNDSNGQLVRATALRGREVRSGTATLGTIDTVIISPNTSRAAALLKPSADVATTTHEVVVPWSQLNLSGGNITTWLTKADIQSATPETSRYAAQDRTTNRSSAGYANVASPRSVPQPETTPEAEGMARENPSPTYGITPSPSDRFAQGAAAPRANEPVTTSPATSGSMAQVDPNLSPTGQTSADQNPYADPKLLSAARAVRQALDADPSLARADVRVMPQNGRLVLSGNVETPALRSTVERLATQSAQGFAIDDQVSVTRDQ